MPASKPPTPKDGRGPIDWEATRARIKQAATASAVCDTSPDDLQAVFRQRARDLAAPLPHYGVSGDASVEATETVTVRIGGQAFAIETSAVREAVLVPRVTPLPGLPPTLRGLANLRSRIVPAFDIRSLLHLPPVAKDSGRETMLLLGFDGAEFGLMVDTVLGVRSIENQHLRRDVPGLMSQHVQGVTGDGLILLDLASLVAALSADERDQ